MKKKKKNKIVPNICNHLSLMPTEWNQPRPEPCDMALDCECGLNQTCPVCGWGQGCSQCPCAPPKKLGRQLDGSYIVEASEIEHIKLGLEVDTGVMNLDDEDITLTNNSGVKRDKI